MKELKFEEVENFRDDLIEVEGIELYPIAGYSMYYADLDNGRIWNNVKQFWLTANPNYLGYCYATVKNDNGKTKPVSVHNLIMLAKTGYPSVKVWINAGYEVHHLDNNTENNEATNLDFKTRKGQYECPITKVTLANRSTKRLSKDDVIAVKTDWLEWEGKKGEFYNLWASKLGVHTRSIQNIIIGFSHKDVEVG